MRFERRWKTHWNGHDIEVVNWWNVLFMCGEQLVIDGRIVDDATGWFSISRDLKGTVTSGATTHAIRAHIGNVDRGLRVGCLIYADDKVIGGDSAKSFLT